MGGGGVKGGGSDRRNSGGGGSSGWGEEDAFEGGGGKRERQPRSRGPSVGPSGLYSGEKVEVAKPEDIRQFHDVDGVFVVCHVSMPLARCL